MKALTLPHPDVRKRTVLKRIAIVVPVLLAVLYLGAGAVAAEVLTKPQRQFTPENTPAQYNLAYDEVRFQSRGDHLQIAGWYMPYPASTRAVILVHGKDSSRTVEFAGRFVELGAMLQRSGLNVLMIDLRGHGQSDDARYSFGLNERRDVEGAVDWLSSKGFQRGSIGVLGVSLGAASAIGAAAEEPGVAALVTDSAFAEFCPVLETQWAGQTGLPQVLLPPTLLMTHLLFGIDLCGSQPAKEIGTVAPRPVLLIHSMSDQMVPVNMEGQLKEALPSAETWVVSGPEHARSFNADPEAYASRVSRFFLANLK